MVEKAEEWEAQYGISAIYDTQLADTIYNFG